MLRGLGRAGVDGAVQHTRNAQRRVLMLPSSDNLIALNFRGSGAADQTAP